MQYRKKPIVIEAFQWIGESINALWHPKWVVSAYIEGVISTSGSGQKNNRVMNIKTLEGNMTAQINDWIIQGVKNEIYPCKPDIFQATYELVENSTKGTDNG